MKSINNSITPTELNQAQNSPPCFSFYENTFDTGSQQTTTPSDIFDDIRSNRYPQVLRARRFHAEGNDDAYDEIKLQLPAFTAAGQFSYRNAAGLKFYSCRIVLDFDDLSDEAIEELRAFCRDLPFVELGFWSPSGEGLKVVCCLSEPKSDIDIAFFHRTAHRQLRGFFAANGFEIDTGDNLDRLCYFSSDPRAFFNPNPHPFEVEGDLTEGGEADSTNANKDIDVSQLSDLTDEYREAIQGLSFKKDGWSKTFLPCIFNDHERDGWDSSHNKMGVLRHARGFTFHCFKCDEKRTYKTSDESPPPSIFSRIPELRILANELGGGDGLSQWTWQYPGEINGQPCEQKNRHLYNPLLKQECPHCHESVPTYIDFARLIAGPHCPECNGHQLKPEPRRAVSCHPLSNIMNFGNLWIPCLRSKKSV